MLAHARYFEGHHAQFVTMLVGYSGMAIPERDDAARLRDGYERMLRGILADGIASGAFRALDVSATGRAVLSMLHWMARWYQPAGPQTAESLAAGSFALLAGGLAA